MAHRYDIALKSVLQRQLRGGALADLLGLRVTEWLATELPEVRTRQVDLLGRADDGRLVHIELQSVNDPNMALRMAEYSLGIYRHHRTFPEQTVLYVGAERLRMKSVLEGPGCSFRHRILDLREMDAEPLLASKRLDDNVIAILARLHGERETIRRILPRIAAAPANRRRQAMKELFLLAGLRKLGNIIETEIRKMPIIYDIMDHDILGPAIRKGIAQGLEKGREEGVRKTVLGQITRRFGRLPPKLSKRFKAMTTSEVERLSLRLLDAESIEELFG